MTKEPDKLTKMAFGFSGAPNVWMSAVIGCEALKGWMGR